MLPLIIIIILVIKKNYKCGGFGDCANYSITETTDFYFFNLVMKYNNWRRKKLFHLKAAENSIMMMTVMCCSSGQGSRW